MIQMTMMAEPLLALDTVSVAYGRRRALDGVSLPGGAGEIVTLLGANGSGKEPDTDNLGDGPSRTGRVVFDGRESHGAPEPS